MADDLLRYRKPLKFVAGVGKALRAMFDYLAGAS